MKNKDTKSKSRKKKELKQKQSNARISDKAAMYYEGLDKKKTREKNIGDKIESVVLGGIVRLAVISVILIIWVVFSILILQNIFETTETNAKNVELSEKLLVERIKSEDYERIRKEFRENGGDPVYVAEKAAENAGGSRYAPAGSTIYKIN